MAENTLTAVVKGCPTSASAAAITVAVPVRKNGLIFFSRAKVVGTLGLLPRLDTNA